MNVNNEHEKHVIKTWLRLVAWLWRDCGVMFWSLLLGITKSDLLLPKVHINLLSLSSSLATFSRTWKGSIVTVWAPLRPLHHYEYALAQNPPSITTFMYTMLLTHWTRILKEYLTLLNYHKDFFTTNDHTVQNPPCLLLFLHWESQHKGMLSLTGQSHFVLEAGTFFCVPVRRTLYQVIVCCKGLLK